ncbi:MAG: alpha-mannosidase [Defluviitaleaceae bacterium]|nr:alpha-mannosidase [Defluviitaleaceae bacterium]
MTVQSADVKGWRIKDGLYWSSEAVDNASEPYRDFCPDKEKWSGSDKNSWFSAEITVPESFDGKPMSLIFATQATGWDAKNPQFLAYLDGRAECGLDVNHTDVFITDHAKTGHKYRVDLQGYTGTTLSGLELTAKIAEISPIITQLYYDLLVPVRIINRLDKDDKVRIDLEVALEKTLNAIDLREPYSDRFYASVDRALEIAGEEIYTKLAGYDDVIATCVGHTHIDVAWWWTVRQTRQKAVRSFATVLKYMEEYPDYVFMSSQPQLYKFVKEHQPALYERIKERAREHRWETEGGMWLEADCNLTSGESLVRQFIYGKKFFADEFDVDSKILWLPDVFGYSAALPQIMKLCGVEYFMTTKLSWNQWNRMPFDTFYWRGIDGSEVFTHMITTTGAENPMERYFTTYNGNLHPNDVMGAWDRYQQKEFNNDVLISYGFGDGGGGPTREMIETGLRMMKGVKGSPKVRFADSRQYFDELFDRVKDNNKLPKWVGELYFEYHRGTYTSMARNKRSNRKGELLLQDLEFISILAENKPYPKTELDSMWETLLLNQFHDILPGTSIKEVYDVTRDEYTALDSSARGLLAERLDGAALRVSGNIAAVNTLGFDRNDIVIMDGVDAEALTDSMGNTFNLQKTHDGKTVAFIEGMPAKGALGLSFADKETIENKLVIDGLKIDTPFYNVEFDENGFISRLFHKESGRDVLFGLGNELRVYEDKPMTYDNWDIDVYYTEKSWLVDDTVTVEWLERGPVRAVLHIERRFLQSVIRQKIHFYAKSPRIDFESYVDWKQSQLLLKTRFITDIKSPHAAYDIQFGNVTRPTHSNTSWDEARFETCAHKWADLSEGGFGVSILNDCKYGHAIHDGVIALTLIKSGIEPYPETDQEEHFFTYSLLPHSGYWQIGGTVHEAHNLNVPAYIAPAAGPGAGLPGCFSFINVDHPNIMIETVKKAESNESVIVRMYEFENTRSNVTVTVSRYSAEVYETNCLEDRKALIAENAKEFTVEFKPYEIKTLELVFA